MASRRLTEAQYREYQDDPGIEIESKGPLSLRNEAKFRDIARGGTKVAREGQWVIVDSRLPGYIYFGRDEKGARIAFAARLARSN